MVWLKDLWYALTFPVRFYVEKYKDYKREKRLQKKIKVRNGTENQGFPQICTEKDMMRYLINCNKSREI